MVNAVRDQGGSAGPAATEEPPAAAPTRSWRHARAAQEQLLRMIAHRPIPTAPPVYASAGASIGLYLVDVGLNLSHVSRVTESLVMTEHDHIARTVEIDLSLDLLTPDQFATGLEYGVLRNASAAPELDPAGRRSTLIWVPVTRMERSHVPPVDLYDTEGRPVPRATQPEVLALLNAALYRTFKQLMEASPPDDDLDAFLRGGNRARWLVEDAFAHIVYSGSQSLTLTPYPTAEALAVASTPGSIRELAATVALRLLDEPAGAAFLDLLHTVSHEYVVVAGLDSSKREHTLRHEMPRLPVQRAGGNATRLRQARSLLSLGREFQVEYSTPVARGLSSFHITVEAENDVHIRHAVLTTDRDQHLVELLCRDLTFLRDSLRESHKGIAKYREYELQYAFGLLYSILQRRLHELSVSPHVGDTDARPQLAELSGVCARFAAGDLTQLAHYTPAQIDHIIDLIQDLELGIDAAFDDDPREDAAHIYWRQEDPLVGRQGPRQPCVATLRLIFADDPPSLSSAVVIRLIALLGTVFGIGVLLLRGFGWLNPRHQVAPIPSSLSLQADALIAVLLIVPSLLVARLEIKSHRSLVGQLQVLGRVCAYSGLVLTAGLAVVVATSTADASMLRTAFLAVSLGLVILTLVLLLDRAVARRKLAAVPLRALGAPKWLWEPWPGHLRTEPDATFESFAGLAGLTDHAGTAGSNGPGGPNGQDATGGRR